MKPKIRILVAEDHLIARIGVTSIINMQTDMTVVAEAVNGQQAVQQYRRHVPDVALLDMRMPVMSGVEAAVAIRDEFPNSHLIALTTYDGDENIRRAVDAGVRAYLTKDVRHEELLKTIRAVYAGETCLPVSLLNLPSPHLSAREIQVLQLVVEGLSNKQIAHQLNIADATAKNHVKNILGKLHVQDRTQAATAAIQRGIITL
ncbi:MAG TPA: response regulator transcription factor [Bryobacteraceae bacterium]|jgi:two-component system NarL family response regulator|nr:response regulator transcription factor [Bryobacteraceae bacterium]